MHPLLKFAIALVCTVFIGLSGYWIFEIVQNIRSINEEPLIATSTNITIPTSEDTEDVSEPAILESAEQQAVYTIVKRVALTHGGGSMAILHQCGGELVVIRHPQTGINTQVCRGLNRLVLERTDGKFHVLDTVDASIDADIPQLTYVTQTVQNGAMVIMIFERNGCPINKQACDITGYRAMTHVLDLQNETFRRLSAYPARSIPVWNSNGTKAVFMAQTCAKTRCDVAPLIGYDLEQDVATRLTQEEGANEDYARDVTGIKLGYWKSRQWTSLSEWTAVFVDANGLAKTLTGRLQ
ncbi:MAG TPA: hypothetical protein PLR08_03465 [bacterium]|nr:hypothetical protein [Candidatus Magasanikbacteria bacterium]HPF95580.1 hypothetical protein [bacterium]